MAVTKKLVKIENNLSFRQVANLVSREVGEHPRLVLDFSDEEGLLSKPLLTEILLRIIRDQGGEGEIFLRGEPYSPAGDKGEIELSIKKKRKKVKRKRLTIKNPLAKVVAYRLLLVVFVAGALLFGGLFALSYYLPQATVSIFVENEILSKGVTMQASPSAKRIDQQKRIIPAQLLAFSPSGKKTIATSGKKEVGDKAEGVATIYNKTDQEKTFSAGTILSKIDTAGESLKYLTVDEVSIPPRKAEISAEAVTYISGKSDVNIIAEEIGEQYNLAEGEELSLESYSPNTYIARTNQGIDGGSSRTISVVTSDDLTKALSELREELLVKARQSVESRVKDEQYFSPDALYLDKETSDFNHQEGEEASELTVEAKETYKLISFYKNDVKSLMDMLVEEFIPDNFSLSADSQDISIADVALVGEGDNAFLSFTAKFRGMVAPELDKTGLASKLSGKTLPVAEQIIQDLPKKTGFEIKLSPSFLPKFLQRMPFREKNIKISTQSND